jgi:hypothetical protein
MFIYSETPTHYFIARAIVFQSEPSYSYLNELSTVVATKEKAQKEIDGWLKDYAVLHHEIERREQPFSRAELDHKAAEALAVKLKRLRAEHQRAEQQLEEHIQSLLALPAADKPLEE